MRSPALVSRQALSRLATRVVGSRFAKPIARVVLVAAGLVLLAVIGRASAAGALGFAPSLVAAPVTAPVAAATPIDAGLASSTPLGVSAAPAPPAPTDPPSAALPAPSRGRASSDDPVVLNTATVDDLRRLPGIGQKRADAILALRTRLGRFRAVEDLMKVKGIGRAMIKRLRPLVRLDTGPARLDAPPATSGARLDAGTITPR